MMELRDVVEAKSSRLEESVGSGRERFQEAPGDGCVISAAILRNGNTENGAQGCYGRRR